MVLALSPRSIFTLLEISLRLLLPQTMTITWTILETISNSRRIRRSGRSHQHMHYLVWAPLMIHLRRRWSAIQSWTMWRGASSTKPKGAHSLTVPEESKMYHQRIHYDPRVFVQALRL